MKKTAAGVFDASKPAGLYFGVVTSENPLKIRVGDINSQLELSESQLILTNAVRDHHVWLIAHDNTEDGESDGAGYHDQVTTKQNQNHIHVLNPGDVVVAVTTSGGAGTGQNITPLQTQTQSQNTDHDHNYHYRGGVFKAKYGLKQDEEVVLLRFQGGQKYLVLDRVGPPEGIEGTGDDEDNQTDLYNPNSNGDREGYT